MTPNTKALLWGAVSGAVASGLFALAKAKRLRERGLLVRTELHTRGDDLALYLAAQGDELRGELEDIARTKGTSRARFVAERLIADEYALGDVTIEQLTRLDRSYKILRQSGYL